MLILQILSISSFAAARIIDCGDSADCTVDCNSGCSDSTIYCSSNCTVYCNDIGSCQFATIISPAHSTTSISCTDRMSCLESIINVASNSSLELRCNGIWACVGLHVRASTNTIIDAVCTGVNDTETCMGSILTVGSDSAINMLCDGYSSGGSRSCFSAEIVGDSGTDINVTCSSGHSCTLMTIDGRDSASLTLNDCTDYMSCTGMEICTLNT